MSEKMTAEDTLDVDNFGGANVNYVVIMFPISCRRVSLSSQDAGQILSEFEVHRALLPNCIATPMVLRYKSQQFEYSKRLILKDYVRESFDEMATVVLPKETISILPCDHLQIEIRHNELGWIVDYNIDTEEILQPPYGIDVLLDAFQLFNANVTVNKYITKMKNIKNKEFK